METAMKRHVRRPLLVMLLILPLSVFVHAQIVYSFAQVNNGYTANSGGTNIIAGNTNDGISSVQNIGFTFAYNCNTYTQFMVSSNGWMVLGSGMTTSLPTNDLTNTTQGPILAPLWDDMKIQSGANVNYKLTGSAPNRVMTIEWNKVLWNASATNPAMSFQVKLYEGSNIIDFVYFREAGSSLVNNGSASIGISSGNSATDFYSVDESPTETYGSETNDINNRPTGNRSYRWTPQTMMSYTSSTTTQASTSAVSKCNGNDQVILGVQVVAGGGTGCQLSATQFQLNMTGSTLPGVTTDVSKIHIYYTGAISVFAPVNEFLPGGTIPAAGNFTVSGSQLLSAGTNYFWVAYDINTATAINADLLDGQCVSVTLDRGVGAQTPTVQNPAGTRKIAGCGVSPGGINGMAFWVKANAGTSSTTDGTAINLWSDQSGNARDASQTTAANQPVYYDNSTNNTNFNPVVDFDNTAKSFMDITSNGILSTGANPYTVYAVIKPGTGNASTPGKYLFAGSAGADNFNSFDIRSGGSLNDSWDLDDLIVGGMWTTNYPTLATYDYNTAQREMFVSGASVGTKTTTGRTSPNSNNALGCQRSATPQIEFYDGSIAEIVTYANYSHNASQHNQVETYLAIKYGITLQHNYVSSAGVTVWNLAQDPAYNTNIIGIARDDISTLSQKQSKSTSLTQDLLTVYIGPSKTTNQASNTGTFTAGDKSFFMVANNNAAYMYPGGAIEKPAGICCRLQREWMVQKTNFTNTDVTLEFDFNVITPGYSPLNTADLRLLVDGDGNFSNATILTPTISVSGSVVKVTLPASNFTLTPYFTLASVSTATTLPVNITGFMGLCKNNAVQLGWTKESGPANSFVVERSADGNNFTDMGALQSNDLTSQTYTWSDPAPLPGVSYYRLRMTGDGGAMAYSSITSINGCTHNNLQLVSDAVTGGAALVMQLQQNATVDISFSDMLGRRYSINNLTGHRAMQQGYYRLPVTDRSLPRGVYVLSVTVNGTRNVFRVVQP